MRFFSRRQLIRTRPDPQLFSEEAFSDYASWQKVRHRDDARFKAQWYWRINLVDAMGDIPIVGKCSYCGLDTHFVLPVEQASHPIDLRESLSCSHCQFNERMRAAVAPLLHDCDPETTQIYLTEQASAAFISIKNRFAHAHGSEYDLDSTRRKKLTAHFHQLGGEGELNERDITALDFADASLDRIGCFDVLEHVPDYQTALREFARCLRPGGHAALTMPFAEKFSNTLVRATVANDGTVTHCEPPEMHGDPVHGQVLCYYHFGWDLLDAARQAGFRSAHWCRAWSPHHGLFGVWTMRAVR